MVAAFGELLALPSGSVVQLSGMIGVLCLQDGTLLVVEGQVHSVVVEPLLDFVVRASAASVDSSFGVASKPSDEAEEVPAASVVDGMNWAAAAVAAAVFAAPVGAAHGPVQVFGFVASKPASSFWRQNNCWTSTPLWQCLRYYPCYCFVSIYFHLPVSNHNVSRDHSKYRRQPRALQICHEPVLGPRRSFACPDGT